jgi:hypothetical protein
VPGEEPANETAARAIAAWDSDRDGGGIPMLTEVGRRYLPEWQQFIGGESILLPFSQTDVFSWWQCIQPDPCHHVGVCYGHPSFVPVDVSFGVSKPTGE